MMDVKHCCLALLSRLSYPVGLPARLGASLHLQMGSLSEECARWYLAEIVVALEHMHGQGIVHRDLKPGSRAPPQPSAAQLFLSCCSIA